MPDRRVFQIGFNKCGTKFLTELFELNGFRGAHWAGGALAEDIAYSKAVGREPLQRWKWATIFTDMESVHRMTMPMLEGFKEYKYLDESFPNSIFVLNTRNIEDWIVSRYAHQGRSYPVWHAAHLGSSLGELAEV
ncbi:sulfotransferase [Paracoccus aminophilus]|uniref:sulfotransferase n=1 Tax=Paracoccus aminophilus TaxID=34003 RepID=UPI0005A0A135|nr:sulfotransferase [Paracoccus aminophilus]